jgi:CheY-like chemotaxis protein
MLQSKKVVVVDDDEKVITLMEKALIRKGFQVFSAHEGKKALELVRREKPQVVITDILQPGLDGGQLCSMVKNDPELENIKVIIITAVYTEANFRLQINCRYDAFIEKPIDINRLTAVVMEKVEENV